MNSETLCAIFEIAIMSFLILGGIAMAVCINMIS